MSSAAKKFPAKSQLKKLVNSKLNGINVASVEDFHSPISSLSLVLPAGTRFQQLPDQLGAANWLKFAAFKTNNKSSSIKITRESEILGHSLSSQLTRESLLLNVHFNRSDLPHVVEEFSEILDGLNNRDRTTWGLYSREFVRKTHEWSIAAEQAILDSRPPSVAALCLDNLFSVAFRSGLGCPLYPALKSIDSNACVDFIEQVSSASGVSLIGYGVDFDDLSHAVSHYMPGITEKAPETVASKYYGGEQHSTTITPNVGYAVAFNGASLAHADYFTALVLKHLLGTNTSSSVKYGTSNTLLGAISPSSASVQAFSSSFSDAGLFGLYAESSSVEDVNKSVLAAVSALKSLASASTKNLSSAVNAAKFELLSSLETASRDEKLFTYSTQLKNGKLYSSAELAASVDKVDESKVQAFVKKMLKSKVSVSSVGGASSIIHSEQLGL